MDNFRHSRKLVQYLALVALLLFALTGCAVYEQPYGAYQPAYGTPATEMQQGYAVNPDVYYAPGSYYVPGPVYQHAPLWFNFNYRSGGYRPDHWHGGRGPGNGWGGHGWRGNGPRGDGGRGGRAGRNR
ncbi:MAG: hypothetical protein ACRYGK_06905 [Janthinobacterium lividum]